MNSSVVQHSPSWLSKSRLQHRLNITGHIPNVFDSAQSISGGGPVDEIVAIAVQNGHIQGAGWLSFCDSAIYYLTPVFLVVISYHHL